MKALFSLGQVVMTPAIRSKFSQEDILGVLGRHQGGDWSEMELDDVQVNEYSVEQGMRIFSSYRVNGEKVWVITEADRSSTCVLFPNEY